MKKYVVANWKSNKTLPEAKKWLEEFCGIYRPDPVIEVILAPPMVYIAPLWQILQELKAANLVLAVQDISPFPQGSYTGAVPARMVQSMAGYALVGHAERRRYFHETNQEVANKASEAIAAGITPILCLDQPYFQAQVAALSNADLEHCLIGYGPVEAIGIDMPRSPEKAGEAIRELRALIPDRPILYGGSIKRENAGTYMALPGVSGLMVGSASLEPREFAAICAAVA